MTMDEVFRGFQNHTEFCKHSLIVETEQRQLVPMTLSPGQVRLREAIAKQRAQERPVRIIYLKSRRIQATTGTAAEFFHATAFTPGVHTVVLAHDAPSSEKIFKIYERFYAQYKPFGGPMPESPQIKLGPSRALSDRINFEFGGDEESSFIQVHTAGNTNFGRSFRITNLHLSEYPYYADAAASRASAMSAVTRTPDTTVVIEGTSRTLGDDFHHLWQEAIDPSVPCEWTGIFMGWWEHPDNRMPLAVSLEKFANSVNAEERDLMGRLNLNYEQLNWRRYVILNEFRGDMQAFHREHPATPEEAFTAASRNRFSVPHIQRMPIERVALVGDLAIETVGVDPRIFFQPDPQNKGALRIYKMPEKGHCYACGADPSGGADINRGKGQADPDWAVAHIFDRDTREQCCTLRLRCWPGEFGKQVARLCRFYGMAQVAIERTGAGVGALEALLNDNYPAGLIYHRDVANDQDPVIRSDKIGWQTDAVSREQLVSLLDEVIRASSIFVRDPTTIQELLYFIIDDERGRPQAQKGTHDDCVIALALTCIVMVRMPRPRPPEGAREAPRVGLYGKPAPDPDARGTIVRMRR
jgi:hypothetical protein